MHQPEIKTDDCPVCGKEESARMGKTEWGHCYMCCSDVCGVKAKTILDKNTSSERYKRLTNQLFKIEQSISKERHKGLLAIEPMYGNRFF